MKVLKDNYYVREILNVLLNNEIISTKFLAEKLNISEKTARNKVDQVNLFLVESNLGKIEKKPRVGIYLVSNEEQKRKLSTICKCVETIHVGTDGEERQDEILKILFGLYPRESVTTQQLANKLFLSSPTVLKNLKVCEEWLSKFNVKISNERNRGFYLSGEESNYRIAFKNFVINDRKSDEIKKLISEFFVNVDINLIEKSIMETEKNWNYRFTDKSFYEIVIYCCLAYQRRNWFPPEELAEDDCEILERYNEYPFTLAIFEALKEKLNVSFSRGDIVFLATQILCSKFIEVDASDETMSIISKYDQKILQFTDELIETIGNVLEIELQDDKILKESLIFHLRPTIFRLKYGQLEKNPLVDFIKREYRTVFRAAWSTSIVFEKYFNLQVTEDELCYIVLYIQSAIERKNYRYKAVLLVDSNSGYAQLLREKIMKSIPEIGEIKTIAYHDFKIYEDKNAEIIISSHKLKESDNRVLVIEDILSENGMVILKNKIQKLKLNIVSKNTFEPICYQLFSPDLICMNEKLKTKEEVLTKLSNLLMKKGCVSPKFYDTVIERENKTTTSIGNGLALPHGAMSEVNDSYVAIAILDEPVAWDDEMVDVVFLLGFKMSTHQEIKRIQTFYKQFISLVDTEEKIKEIKNKENELDLFRYLIR